MPIREIARRTGLSRNTIRKYLRAEIVEPNFQTPMRPSKLDPFAEKLSGWLVMEQRKSRKERRTAKRMHPDLVQLGFDGSYERVAAFVRAWKADKQLAQQTTGRGAPAFPDLQALNQWLEDRCKVLWAETAHGSLPGSIADAWEAEKSTLMPLPTAFDGFVELSKRVSPTCLITFDRNRYSVPASFANRPVSLHIYPERLVIVAEGTVICTHERIIERSHRQPGRVIYDWRHCLAVVQRKPRALRNGAPFVEMPEAFRKLQSLMLRKPGGDREVVDILSLVLHHDEQAVLCAVEMALEAGVPTKTHVLPASQAGGWKAN